MLSLSSCGTGPQMHQRTCSSLHPRIFAGCYVAAPFKLRSTHLSRRQCTVQAAAPAGTTGVDSRRAGRMTYKPASFREMVQDAATSLLTAIEEGDKRLEVEFPPLPVSSESYKSGSDSFVDSNTQLALTGAKSLAAAGRRVHVILPDFTEYARAYKKFRNALDLMTNVTLGHLLETTQSTGGPFESLQGLFGGGPAAPPSAPAAAAADTFIVINAYAVDLNNVEKYVKEVVKDRIAILWNLELDTLRGDLGMMGYPPKEMHHGFLAEFRPAFYLRPRDYSKSVNVSPFIINYSGALFREYPGPWQVMLKADGGEYACIAERPERYNLGDAKEELYTAMGLNTEAEGSTMAFLRRGYKTSTWWEDAIADDKSANWRS